MANLIHAIQNPSPYFKAIRNSFIADIEYRSSYYLLIFASFVTVFMELAVFDHIFSKQESAGDLHHSQALSFIVLGLLLRNGVTLWSNISDWIEQIRDGSFRKFLLQPLHMPSYFFANAIGPKITTWTLSLVTFAICKIFFSSQFSMMLPLHKIPMFLMLVTFAYFLTWQLYLTVIYVAFWVEEASALSTAFNLGMGIFTGTLIPLSWFPPWFREIISYTPFPLIGSFPLQFAISEIPTQLFYTQFLSLLSWILLVLFINAFLKQSAFKRFEAFGG